MPEDVAGVPIHPLVVHAVVVLLPLAALGVIAIAFVPAWRQRFGGLVALLTLVAVGMVPLATESGENLQEVVFETPAIDRHGELGSSMAYFAIPLLVVACALWWVGRRDKQRKPYGKGITTTLAVVSVVVALAAAGWVVRVGHSGAVAVWGTTGQSASGG